MAGQEDVATQPGLPSAHENTAVIIEDHEANEQRLQSLMLPFACEDSATIGDHRATDQQKTQTLHTTSLTIGENAQGDDNTIPESMACQANEHGPTVIVPEVGMSFESGESAYEMYNTYAGLVGFSIRKHDTKRRADKTMSSKVIVCSQQGHGDASSSKGSSRTGCNARVLFSISREGIWTVQHVELEHNHYMASPGKTHMLRSQRRVMEADRKLISQIREAGMKPSQVYEFMKQFYGRPENVPFLKIDCCNEIGRERKKYLECNDAQTLLEYLKNKQMEDPTFFYAIEINKENGRITNFFWADGQSIMDYKCFGDAVSFDTTFQTNKFEMPFAPLLGTNHHKQTIIFGAALLFDETIPSFIWLFETFLTAMSGKHPSTIFTNQDAAMAGAIAYVFPNTSHRLCLWHIYLNAAKHLSHVINKHPKKFLPAFKSCVYEDRSEECFEEKWNKLLTDYSLQENSWMLNLYDLRKKWAAVYRDSFTADMTTTQRSEGMNNVFKKRFRRKLGLSELIVECEKVSASLRENELYEDFKSRTKDPVKYIPDFPLLKTAAESYTRRMYKEFEEEFKSQFSFTCKLVQAEGSISTFMVTHRDSNVGATVVLNTTDKTITCSCRKFESIGILCRHALKVFNMTDIFMLPSQYILNRWTKYAKRGFYVEKKGKEKENLKAHAARLSRMATSLALKCSVSKPLLDDLERALQKLELEADHSLNKMEETGFPVISNDCSIDTVNSKISFRVPEVVKGSKNKRAKNAVEKNTGKKRKSSSDKGKGSRKIDQNKEHDQDPKQLNTSFDESIGANMTVHNVVTNDVYADFPAMVAPLMPGGYTSLLLGVDQEASAARKLHFDEAHKQ